jgi:peptide alpha-N-acetyltransferase
MALVGNELSEPYSIYTYKYFVHYWPELCILVSNSHFLDSKMSEYRSGIPFQAQDHDREEGSRIVGAIICKLEQPQQREGLLAQEEPGHEQQQQPPLDNGISSGTGLGSKKLNCPENIQSPPSGYIAMLAVHQSYRGLGLGTRLVHTALRVMEERGCDEVGEKRIF